jgi:hypothetical protein
MDLALLLLSTEMEKVVADHKSIALIMLLTYVLMVNVKVTKATVVSKNLVLKLNLSDVPICLVLLTAVVVKQ